MSKSAMLSFVAVVVGVSNLWASPHFTLNREDLSVPEKCRDMQLSFYSLPAEVVFIGREGGVAMGYTLEYPVSRNNAQTLWKYFKDLAQGEDNQNLKDQILNNPAMKRDYEIIMRNYQEQDFSFSSEGDILELLAIHDMYNEFPENEYYITGGVAYHEAHSPQTIGELDLFVGRRDSCDAVLVGETKLGTRKMLNKAKDQLDRFESFLMGHDSPGFSGEYDSIRR